MSEARREPAEDGAGARTAPRTATKAVTPLAWSIALFALSVALYFPSASFELTVDSPLVTTENPNVGRAPPELGTLFTSSLYAGTIMGGSTGNLYRPVLTTTLALDYAAAGYRFDPGRLHLTNTALYGLCVVLVFWFVRTLRPGEVLVPALTALLFAAFPAHVETVTNVKHREEMLALGFGLAAYLVAGRRGGRMGWGAASFGGLLFLLALLSKESAVLLAPAFLLARFVAGPGSRDEERGVPTWVPLAAALAVYVAMRGLALGALLEPAQTYHFHPADLGALPRVAGSAETFVRYYVFDQLVGLRLNPSFSSPFVVPLRPAVGPVNLACLAGVLALGVAALWRLVRRGSTAAYAVVFFLATSAILLQVVPIGTAGAFRLQFTPSLGLCLLLATALAAAARRGAGLRGGSPRAFRIALVAGAGLVLGAYAARTIALVPSHRDDGALFGRAAALEPLDPLPAYAVSRFLERKGEPAMAAEMLRETLRRFRHFEGAPEVFDERSVDVFSVVATEVALLELERDPESAIRLADLGIALFERLRRMRDGRQDSNVAGPYFVKAMAQRALGRIEDCRRTCHEGLGLTPHRGLQQILRELPPR